MDRQSRRRHRASDPADLAEQAALLRERVRRGALSQEDLELAAYVGHPAARVARGLPPLEPPGDPQKLQLWVRGLLRFGAPVVIRALLAAARSAGASGGDDELCLEAASDWADCPCDRHGEAVYRVSRLVESGTPAYFVVMSAHTAAHFRDHESLPSMVRRALRELLRRDSASALRRAISEGLLAACGLEAGPEAP